MKKNAHPYDDFLPRIDMVSFASVEDKVLADAAELGKQVTILVELKVRFDVEIIMVGLKTHYKLLMVLRRKSLKTVPYVHMLTSNYNDEIAKLYANLGLIISHPGIREYVDSALAL